MGGGGGRVDYVKECLSWAKRPGGYRLKPLLCTYINLILILGLVRRLNSNEASVLLLHYILIKLENLLNISLELICLIRDFSPMVIWRNQDSNLKIQYAKL